MTALSRLLVIGGVLWLIPELAEAQCTNARCTDLDAVANVRALVGAACDCEGARSHGQYVKCAKQIVKAAVRDGTLQKPCRGSIMKCEARSTCGKANRNICCVVSPKGKVKALAVRGPTCPRSGTMCEGHGSLADACTIEGACVQRGGIQSFRSVQRVFTTSCALPSCHSTFARQGGLVLDSEDVSYKSLVNRDAVHPEAPDGLLRVQPGDPAASYLVQKLRGQGPGDVMPQSGGPLAEPLIEMIEAWIARGARTYAEECADANACDDDGPIGDYHWEPLPALEVPASNDGIQLYFPKLDVPSGTEWERCYAVRPDWAAVKAQMGLGSNELLVIRQQTYRMHPGSHHLLLYAYVGAHPEQWPDGPFPCLAANCIDPGDCPVDTDNINDPDDPTDDDTALVLPIGGTQVAGTRYEVNYPPGVGIPILSNNEVLIVNPHYTNPFQPAQPIYGEAWLNLFFYKSGEYKVLLDGIFAINFADLFVEPFETRTISRVWQPRPILGGPPGSVDAAVFQLFGHMHKRGSEFQIDYLRGGSCSVSTSRPCGRDSDCPDGQTCVRVPGAEDTTIYYTTAWDQAPIMDFPYPYFPVAGDEGLRWTCTHTNGVEGDPTRPPKRCTEGCRSCGWDDATRTCIFERGVQQGFHDTVRVYQEGDPMPLVFGELADDDMCNMFGYFIHGDQLPLISPP
jgi:hypothetical protein